MLTFAHTLDHDAVIEAAVQLMDLVDTADVADAWDHESSLPGMTVGGLTRHLVSQPECTVEFLCLPAREDAPLLGLIGHYDRLDWLDAPLTGGENTSIRDDWNRLGAAGHADSVAVLARSLDRLDAAIGTAGSTTYVPWQECRLPTDDFLVVRAMEMMVHADDLAVSVGLAAPHFQPEVAEPVLALLAALAARRHGQLDIMRALSRAERPYGALSAF